MGNTKIVSQMDILHLELIRANVRKFIHDCAGRFDKPSCSVLDVAPQDHKGAREFFNTASVKTLDLNPASGADLIADLCVDNSRLIEGGQFDLVICTEVLEHTLNPFDAVKEIHRLLKKGGTAAVSTPFNFRIHGPLPDCWRFTEHGLRQLFSQYSRIEITPLDAEGRELMPVQYTLLAEK